MAKQTVFYTIAYDDGWHFWVPVPGKNGTFRDSRTGAWQNILSRPCKQRNAPYYDAKGNRWNPVEGAPGLYRNAKSGLAASGCGGGLEGLGGDLAMSDTAFMNLLGYGVIGLACVGFWSVGRRLWA